MVTVLLTARHAARNGLVWVGVGWWCGFNKVRDGTETAAPSLVCVWGGSMLGWEGAWSGTVSDAVRGVGH